MITLKTHMHTVDPVYAMYPCILLKQPSLHGLISQPFPTVIYSETYSVSDLKPLWHMNSCRDTVHGDPLTCSTQWEIVCLSWKHTGWF